MPAKTKPEPCFMDYVNAVDVELQRRYGLTVMDAGIEFDSLASTEEENWSPKEYVDWFAEKMDLVAL